MLLRDWGTKVCIYIHIYTGNGVERDGRPKIHGKHLCGKGFPAKPYITRYESAVIFFFLSEKRLRSCFVALRRARGKINPSMTLPCSYVSASR